MSYRTQGPSSQAFGAIRRACAQILRISAAARPPGKGRERGAPIGPDLTKTAPSPIFRA
ncbi:protein of unknown function [Methylocella tundrae]|uniref:Uncharacterized protein n=1 Tax=Methylocella tundrae TaxID=227605 RepID=A0A4U8Z659_METTU|nr:protein of unknown function [Methylocella tundrae]